MQSRRPRLMGSVSSSLSGVVSAAPFRQRVVPCAIAFAVVVLLVRRFSCRLLDCVLASQAALLDAVLSTPRVSIVEVAAAADLDAFAVVVLGHRLTDDNLCGAPLASRVDAAVHIASAAARAPLLLLSGGVPPGCNTSEAEAMAALVRRRGCAAELLLETASTSTRENAVQSLALLGPRVGEAPLLVVTSAYHAWRAGRVFAAAARGAAPGPGIAVVAVDPRDDEARAALGETIPEADRCREFAARLLYASRGWL